MKQVESIVGVHLRANRLPQKVDLFGLSGCRPPSFVEELETSLALPNELVINETITAIRLDEAMSSIITPANRPLMKLPVLKVRPDERISFILYGQKAIDAPVQIELDLVGYDGHT
jgi:hypothetical protein